MSVLLNRSICLKARTVLNCILGTSQLTLLAGKTVMSPIFFLCGPSDLRDRDVVAPAMASLHSREISLWQQLRWMLWKNLRLKMRNFKASVS